MLWENGVVCKPQDIETTLRQMRHYLLAILTNVLYVRFFINKHGVSQRTVCIRLIKKMAHVSIVRKGTVYCVLLRYV